MPNGMQITAAPPPLQRKKMCTFEPHEGAGNLDYPTAALLPVFATGIARFAGYEVAPVAQCREGMRAVFKYWLDNKLPCCGNEPDIAEVAFSVAAYIADQVYGDDIAEKAAGVLADELRPNVVPGGCQTLDPQGLSLPPSPVPLRAAFDPMRSVFISPQRRSSRLASSFARRR